jgi:hypothetical protein
MSVVALARVVRESVQEVLESTDRGILNGVQTWEEYQRLLGKRQGLQQALNALDDEVHRFDQQD